MNRPNVDFNSLQLEPDPSANSAVTNNKEVFGKEERVSNL